MHCKCKHCIFRVQNMNHLIGDSKVLNIIRLLGEDVRMDGGICNIQMNRKISEGARERKTAVALKPFSHS